MIKIPISKRTTIVALEFKFKRYQGVIEAAAFTAISGDSGDSFSLFCLFRQLRFCQNTGTRWHHLGRQRYQVRVYCTTACFWRFSRHWQIVN